MKWIMCPVCHNWHEIESGTSDSGSFSCENCENVFSY